MIPTGFFQRCRCFLDFLFHNQSMQLLLSTSRNEDTISTSISIVYLQLFLSFSKMTVAHEFQTTVSNMLITLLCDTMSKNFGRTLKQSSKTTVKCITFKQLYILSVIVPTNRVPASKTFHFSFLCIYIYKREQMFNILSLNFGFLNSYSYNIINQWRHRQLNQFRRLSCVVIDFNTLLSAPIYNKRVDCYLLLKLI